MKKMQSILLSGVVVFGLGNSVLADENANGVFVGLHSGATMMGISGYVDGKKEDTMAGFGVPEFKTVYNIGLKVGYQYYFHPVIGIRGYVSYDFNSSRSFFSRTFTGTGGATIKYVSDATYHNITFNADLLINCFSAGAVDFGVYAGFGLGYGINVLNDGVADWFKMQDIKYSGFNIPVNVGFMLNILGYHQIELGAKIPTLSSRYDNTAWNQKSYVNPYAITVGYSFIF